MTNAIAISELDEEGALDALGGLSCVLHDCVAAGASVSFMWPFEIAEAHAYWRGIAEAVRDKRTSLFVAVSDGAIAGTVQLGLDGPCNQKHRGEIRKLLVLRSARRLGIARALMLHAEERARASGLTLLTLDTATGGSAEALYRNLGWQEVGVIPRYAKWPDGRYCDTTVFFKPIG